SFDRLRSCAEIILVEAPGNGAVVNCPAARLIAVIEPRKRVRALFRVCAPRDRLAFHVRTQIAPLEISQFVLRAEVRRGQTWAAFQADDLHTRLAEFCSEDSAHRAHADDDDIRFFSCPHGSLPLWLRPFPLGL